MVGEAWVYAGNWVRVLVALASNPFFLYTILSKAKSVHYQDMIRERVLTRGIVRPFEPELELPALQLTLGRIGTFSALQHLVDRRPMYHDFRPSWYLVSIAVRAVIPCTGDGRLEKPFRMRRLAGLSAPLVFEEKYRSYRVPPQQGATTTPQPDTNDKSSNCSNAK